MSEDKKPIPDPDPLEEEIGELLAEAEALTSELSTEIGEDHHVTRGDPGPFESDADSGASAEQQLRETERALDETTSELGGEKKTTPSAGLKLPPAKSISLPEKSDKPKPHAHGTVSLPTASSSAKTETLIAAKTSEPAIDVKEPVRSRRVEELNKKIAQIGERLEPVSRAVGAMLDTIDRPFSRIRLGLRTVLGWLALMFLVAALSLWLFAVR